MTSLKCKLSLNFERPDSNGESADSNGENLPKSDSNGEHLPINKHLPLQMNFGVKCGQFGSCRSTIKNIVMGH